MFVSNSGKQFVGTYDESLQTIDSSRKALDKVNSASGFSTKNGFMFESGNNLYLGSGVATDGLKVSTDDGATWTNSTLAKTGTPIDVTNGFMQKIGSKLYVGTQNDGLWESSNDGTSWTQSSLKRWD